MLFPIPDYTASENGIGIRPYRQEDGEPMYEAVMESLTNLNRFLACFKNTNRQEVQNLVNACVDVWRKGEQFYFVIFDVATNHVLGSVSIERIDPFNFFASIGYWVRSSALKKGVAKTAALLAARFAFQKLGLVRLELVIDITNLASQRVAEKIGALKEGVLRRRLIHNNAAHSAFMYSLIPEDLNIKPSRLI